MAGTFTLDLTKFVEKAKGNATLVVKKVAFDMFSRIVQRTPVDTGRARANWQIGINSIPSSSISFGFKTGKQGWGAGGKTGFGGIVRAEGGASANADLGVVGREGKNLSPFKIGDIIYLANNVGYITFLEYGTGKGGFSKQAPMGMVRITITEFQNFVAAAVASL